MTTLTSSFPTPTLTDLVESRSPEEELERAEWRALSNGDWSQYAHLKAQGSTFDWIDPDGRHPLHVAVSGGCVPIIADLLDTFHHDINGPDEDGETPIRAAVRSFSPQRRAVISFLKNRGADLSLEASMEADDLTI